MTSAAARSARPLHPVSWWAWALGLAVAASLTTNPVLLGLVIAVVGYVAVARRPMTPWSRSYVVFLRLGLVVLAVRIGLFALVAGAPGNHVLLRLPQLGLPEWLAGLRLGGPVTLEGLLSASYDGLRLAAVLCCIGAANTLTNPRRLLKSLPAALFAAGVAVTVAMSVAPQAVASLSRLRAARRMRGHADRGWRSVRGLLLPVLEGALDGSVELAAAMDSRGFGRRAARSGVSGRVAATATLLGLLLAAASSYGVLAGSAPSLLGWPLLGVGLGLLVVGLIAGSRGGRSHYRPDPWRWRETVVAASGILPAVAVSLAPLTAIDPSTYPPVVPALPLAAMAGVLVALLPALLPSGSPPALATRPQLPSAARERAAA